MALGTLVKSLQNIMRNDAGVNGDAQRIEQMTCLSFSRFTMPRRRSGNSTMIPMSP